MHVSLDVRTNILLLTLYAAVIVACIWSTGVHSLAILVPFFMAGILAGWLQSQSIRAIPQQFLGARSLVQVRRALWCERKGKASILMSWAAGAACLAIALLQPLSIGIAVVLAAYASFCFARELVATRVVRSLSPSSGGEEAK